MGKLKKDLKCKWCGKAYAHQGRLDKHEPGCEKIGRSGETKDAAKPRAAHAVKAASEPSSRSPKPSKKVGPIQEALDLLYAKKHQLIASYPELDSVINAISALEEIKA